MHKKFQFYTFWLTMMTSCLILGFTSTIVHAAVCDKIIINEEGISYGSFIATKNAYSVTIIGGSNLDQEKIILAEIVLSVLIKQGLLQKRT